MEFIVFSVIYKASEFPDVDYDTRNNILKYQPNQKGNFRKLNEIEANFRINSNGWNSVHNRYEKKDGPKDFLTAVIGDSFVFGAQVNVEDNRCSVLENLSSDNSLNSAVYNFGVSGTSLSHYLHVMRYTIKEYSPDRIIVNIVHNDFMSSFAFVFNQHRFATALMTVDIGENSSVSEVAPLPYKRQWWEKLMFASNTYRALWYRLGFSSKFTSLNFLLKEMLRLSKGEPKYEANIDVQKLTNKERAKKIKIMTEYVFKEMKLLADENNIELLIVMNAVTQNIYDNIKNVDSGAYNLNVIASEAAMSQSIPFIDLTSHFKNDFEKNGARFEFENDGHWNKRTHELVAKIIFKHFKDSVLHLN